MTKPLIVGLAVLTFSTVDCSTATAQQARPADLRLSLNIPASRLDVFEDGVRTRSYPVSAGRRGFETPAGKYHIRQLIWNPWWHPPKSAWARNEKPAPPGPNNPMGRLKINFANLLYIHGTFYEDDIGAPASHGCIRMSDRNLVELAHKIHSYRTPGVDPRIFATLEKNRTMTRSFHIKAVPFDVVYRLVEVVDGRLIIHPDVYRSGKSDLSAEIVGALKKEGIPVTEQLAKRLAPLSKKRNATRIHVALDSLLTGPAGD